MEKITPRLYSMGGEYSVGTEKNTSAQKHIIQTHDYATGEVIQLQQQPSGPALTQQR